MTAAARVDLAEERKLVSGRDKCRAQGIGRLCALITCYWMPLDSLVKQQLVWLLRRDGMRATLKAVVTREQCWSR